MSEYNEIKKIAELQAKTDADVQWDINNLLPKEIYVSAFAEGFMYSEEIHKKAFDGWMEKLKNQGVTQCGG